MPLPPVVIEVSPPVIEAALAEALVTACSYSAVESSCALAETYQGTSSAIAIVSWRSDVSVRIEVGLRRDGSSRWRTRDLEFRRQDPPIERWKAVGFVVGTLAGEVASTRKPETSTAAPDTRSEPPRAADTTAAVPAPAEAEEDDDTAWIPRVDVRSEAAPVRYRGWLDAGVLVGPPLGESAWRLGAQLRGSLMAERSPVLGTASFSYSAETRDEYPVTLTWLGGSVGVGLAPFGVKGDWAFVLRSELVGHVLTASTELEGETDRKQRWVGSFRGGVDLAWLPEGSLGAVLGGSALVTPGKTEFVVSRQGLPAGETRTLSFELELAARLEFK